jgi:glycerol kinase
MEEGVRAKTGLVLDPYFSGTKAEWMLRNVAGVAQGASDGRLLYGTIDSFLGWKLTGQHVTDPSNASRTLLYDIHGLRWDEGLCGMLGVPMGCLPRVVDNAGMFGRTRGVGFLPDGIPVAGLAGDQQSALFGQACFAPGMAKCTYGTGAFLLMNTGATAMPSKHGMLTTVGWRLGGATTYAIEGSAFIAGAAVQWLRDGLGIIEKSSDVEALARSVPDTAGVVFVPALAGLGAPHWRPDARGVLVGLTRGVTRGHIARAVLEGVALQITDILDAMAADAGAALGELRVDGGAARNDLMMQFQADVLGVDCVRPTNLETTAMGAAYLAGIGTGFWDSPAAVSRAWAMDRRFSPGMDSGARARKRAGWSAAVAKA